MLARCTPLARQFGLAAALFVLSVVSGAQTFTYRTADNEIRPGTENQGRWTDHVGSTVGSNDANYVVGNPSGIRWRSFFMFDLTDLAGTVTSATLHVKTFDVYGPVTLEFHDVSTYYHDLVYTNGNPSVDIYNDLGDGPLFGTVTLENAPADGLLDVDLNADALAAIQAHAGDWFSIGVSVSNATPDGIAFYYSHSSDGENRMLVRVGETGGNDTGTTPVSGAATALIGSGLAGFAIMRRRFPR